MCLGLAYVTSILMGVPRMSFNIGILFVAMLVVSISLDLIWFVVYVRYFWNEQYIDSNSLNGVRVWTVIDVIILWGIKVVAA